MSQRISSSDKNITAGFLNTDWTPRELPAGTTTQNIVLRTQDGAATGGALYKPSRKTDTVVCIMHPREFMACHYLIPDITEVGYAAWSQWPRSVGNDLRLEHETALFDVAAAMIRLRAEGFKHIILLGNSGGSGLYSLYIQQSSLDPTARILKTPGGRPTNLEKLEMVPADGLILVAPHPGQGALLMGCIDPSVTTEGDAFSTDPSLDPFDQANGYDLQTKSAHYSPDFVKHYRAAQASRVSRLDELARTLIKDRISARGRLKSGSTDMRDTRLAAHSPIITVWRTDADLRCFDLSLDPSDRKPGSLWGSNPLVSNLGSVGFARLCSPESWLSTWSGISSNALLSKTAPHIKQPTLLIEYTGDQACFPSIIKSIYDSLGASSKIHHRVRGDHHGRALSVDEEPGRYQAGRLVGDWLRTNFPQ